MISSTVGDVSRETSPTVFDISMSDSFLESCIALRYGDRVTKYRYSGSTNSRCNNESERQLNSYKPRKYSKLVRRNYNSNEREIYIGQFV